MKDQIWLSSEEEFKENNIKDFIKKRKIWINKKLIDRRNTPRHMEQQTIKKISFFINFIKGIKIFSEGKCS